MNRMNPYRSIMSAAVTILLLLLVGCSHRTPEAIVAVVDTSHSITPRAEKAALDAVQEQITHMRRGDILVIIPITGSAANDAGGRILRLAAPIRRETYDADIRRFQEQSRTKLAAWVASLDPHQSRTDIFGAIAVANQEFALIPKKSTRRLIVVSDFLEDDGTYRFVSAGQLANPARARQLAARLRDQDGFVLKDVTLCLGRLESSDFASLKAERKEAVDVFWTTYFAAGAMPRGIQFDGPGLLADPERGCAYGS